MADKKDFGSIGADLTEAGKIRDTLTRTTATTRGKGRPRRANKITYINTAYNNDNYTFVKLLANIKGVTFTQQVNDIIADYRANNAALDKKVKSLQRFLKRGGYLQTKGGVLDRYDIDLDAERPEEDPAEGER